MPQGEGPEPSRDSVSADPGPHPDQVAVIDDRAGDPGERLRQIPLDTHLRPRLQLRTVGDVVILGALPARPPFESSVTSHCCDCVGTSAEQRYHPAEGVER